MYYKDMLGRARLYLAHFQLFGGDGGGVRLFWAFFATLHDGCNKCPGGITWRHR